MRVDEALQAAVPSGHTPPRLFQKRLPEDLPVTPRSAVLFRFGEQCNNDCPMCSNTGKGDLFFYSTEELLRRAAFLHSAGFRRAVVTGGEATIHPGFWTVVERLAANAMAWDTNTHGRTFSRPGFARRAADTGLQRAIVSLHSHDPATSAAIFGSSAAAHYETVAGIEQLVEAGVDVMLNCVINRLNLDQLDDYLEAGRARFGRRVTYKFAFPVTIGRGGQWEGIATLRYADVRERLPSLRALAARLGVRLFFESFPNCTLGNADAVHLGRRAFGETHYLDDRTGDRVYSMRHVEAALAVYAEFCRTCAAVRRCPGVSREYALQHGVGELLPFPSAPAS